MSVHHIIRSDEQSNSCLYCGKNINPRTWESVFDGTNFHYKEHQCSCGRRCSIKVSFIGSGDDSWSPSLDKKIAEVDSELNKK